MKQYFLLFTILSAVLTCFDASASEWVGEHVTSGSTYYIYDVMNTSEINGSIYNKFLTHDALNSKDYPAWGDYAQADPFKVTTVGLQKYFKIYNTELQKYLAANGEGLQPYSSMLRLFDHKEATGDFQVAASSKSINRSGSRYKIFYRFAWSCYYLHEQTYEAGNNGLPIVSFERRTGETLGEHQWAFISMTQYEMRPKLDNLIEEINNYAWEGTMSEELSNSLTEANKALIATSNVGEALSTAYTKLQEQFDIAKGVETELVSARKDLGELITTGIDVKSQWTGSLGDIPTDLESAIAKADEVLTATKTNLIEAARKVLSEKMVPYTDAQVLSINKMMVQSEALGYSLPETQKLELLENLSNNTIFQNITTLITAIQTEFKKWVNNVRINNGKGFPVGADFSAYILNNSFEMGTTQCWATPTENAQSAVDEIGSLFYYYLGKSKLAQGVTNLPTGIYSLSAQLNEGADIVATVDGEQVKDITKIAITKGQKLMIYIAGKLANKNYSVDDLKLTLIGGAASTYTFDETIGVDANTPTGKFSTVTNKRSFKPSTNWNTFCSPCDIDADKKNELFSSVYTLSGAEYTQNEDTGEEKVLSLKYTKIEENEGLKAGITYLVKATDSFSSYTVSDAEVVKEPKNDAKYTEGNNAGVMMLGTFEPYDKGAIPCFTGNSDLNGTYSTYILQNNEFRRLPKDNKISMKAFRGYFHIYHNQENETGVDGDIADAAPMRMVFEDTQNTAIETLTNESTASTLYSLQGVQVADPAAGLYISRGKKYLIKQ